MGIHLIKQLKTFLYLDKKLIIFRDTEIPISYEPIELSELKTIKKYNI